MVAITDLPDNVIVQILKKCTQPIVHQLLKSETIAPLAYSVYYEEVALEAQHSELQIAKITHNYIDLDETDPFKWCTPVLDHTPIDKSCSFYNPKELISFYQTHPLYEPHTLIYFQNSDLAELERLKPGFLSKFKLFEYMHSGADEVVYDVSKLKHKTFTNSQSLPLDQYPEHIETLINVTQFPVISRDSVKIIVNTAPAQTFNSFEKFPNLYRMFLFTDVPGQLDISSLTKLSLSTKRADLSKLTNLKYAAISLENQFIKAGYSDEHGVQLPPNLESLLIEEIWECEQINLEREQGNSVGESNLKELSLGFYGLVEKDFSKVFIPNVTRLAVAGEYLLSERQRFPETIETLILTGLELIKPILPPNVKVLNLLRTYYEGIDFTEFKNLTMVSAANQKRNEQFPPSVQNIQSVEHNDKSFIPSMSNVKFLNTRYLEMTEIDEMVLPSSLETLIVETCFWSTITGGENLQNLEIVDYTCTKQLSLLSLKSLKSLTLSAQVTADYGDDLELPLLPPSVEALTLERLHVLGFECPPNLKFLKASECNFRDSSFTLNDSLEVVYLENVQLDTGKFFKRVSKSLETVYLMQCALGSSDIDFTGSNLQRFSIGACEYTGKKVKFPKCLKMFRVLDSINDESETTFLDWADISLCDELCEVYYPEVKFEKKENIERLEKFTQKSGAGVLNEISSLSLRD